MAKILQSADNPHGWKLEALLAVIGGELAGKSALIKDDTRPVARRVLRNNQQIVGLLQQAEALQLDSQDALDTLGADQGPEGRPRIGKGSESEGFL
jgi:hypothetical protein